jgi:hypothetical protein
MSMGQTQFLTPTIALALSRFVLIPWIAIEMQTQRPWVVSAFWAWVIASEVGNRYLENKRGPLRPRETAISLWTSDLIILIFMAKLGWDESLPHWYAAVACLGILLQWVTRARRDAELSVYFRWLVFVHYGVLLVQSLGSGMALGAFQVWVLLPRIPAMFFDRADQTR